MVQFTQEILPGRVGVITAEGALAEVYRRDPAYTEVVTEEEAHDEAEHLKGKKLDAELRAHNLSTKGSAEEKRQRLADALATPPAPEVNALAAVPDAGVLPPEDDAPASIDPSALDRDAVGAVPHTQGVTLDRDADQSEEN